MTSEENPAEGEGSATPGPNGGEAGRKPAGRTKQAVAALAVILVAGGAIYWNLSNLQEPLSPSSPAVQTFPAVVKPPESVADDANPAEVRSRLSLLDAEGGGRTAVMSRAVAPEDFDSIAGTSQKLLDRELVRQAVLLAARDERGIATRDELLDDASLPTGDAPTLEISTLFRPERTRVMIRKVVKGEVDPLAILSKSLGDGAGMDDYPLRLAAQMERMARTDFPKLLDEAGVKGTPNQVKDSGPVPEGVEEKLRTLGLIEHVQALRSLHQAIRTDGESPERLGALARAYAQLAMLTVHHWSAAYRGFEARAMLYAERLVARAPESASALRHRAFVRGIVGVHGYALKDLEAAAELDSRTPNPAPAPEWAGVLDAYLRYDLPRLDAAEGASRSLAALLKMAALEFPVHTRLLVRSAEAVVQADPDCGRAFDVICGNGALGDQHQATVLGPQAFESFFRAKLKGAADLPAPVRAALDRDADGPALVAALDDAGRPQVDADEPSWGVLAHLARETRFVQVHRRLYFMARTWNVPVDDFWNAAAPLVEGHRYRPYLAALTQDRGDLMAFAEFAEKLDRSDIEPTQGEFIRLALQFQSPRARYDGGVARGHGSHTARDFSLTLGDKSSDRVARAESLLRVSPHNPYAKAMLIKHDWEKTQPKLEDWAKADGTPPAVLRALGTKYLELKRFAEARDNLARYVELSPDQSAYEDLAACYEGEGDEERWLATLDDYLENTEDAGLEHARVQVKLAYHFLGKGRPEKAKDYSDAAAQTGAGWAMMCAAEVEERLGDLDEAESWSRRVSERYGDSWGAWYIFCQRTGRGDLDDARAVARAAVRRPDAATPDVVAWFYWLEKEPDQAIRVLESWIEVQPGPASMMLLILYDQIGAEEKRDAVLERIVGGLEGIGPKTAGICRLLRDALADPNRSLDLAAVDAAIESIRPDTPDFMHVVVGKFLLMRGRPEDARKYLEACAGDPAANGWNRAAAASWLREAFPETKPPEPGPKPAPAPKPDPTRT
ncbi:tetratricopeptide repeat protein [Planctomyces sp. SH-PL62]|uniref:tetratricopeptide repeat protein n=1 Tax=Planctomyces sp. SH-PL62 TaxID=1636152 RepID=UPI00078BF6E6|nr:hypothetical protein [Planctomyces sp. SH-PL62]AMV37590.1 hypothetical protein VT85_09145 [Planctomyces sp. SH-PL62]